MSAEGFCMFRRIVLLFTIVAMCILVIFGGFATFVNSNSVLKVSSRVQTVKSAVPVRWYVFIDVTDCRMSIYRNGIKYRSYPVSSGKKYIFPSPIGTWRIIEKDEWGESFGGRWLGLNVPWAIQDFGTRR
jgi:hypothetical protein